VEGLRILTRYVISPIVYVIIFMSTQIRTKNNVGQFRANL